MRQKLFSACVALTLVACGGGGGGDQGQLASSQPSSVQILRAKVVSPTLLSEQVSVVNTTTAGQQVLRSIGALTDGGYTVAWLSGDATLYIQRYDSSGKKKGGETLVPLSVQAANDAASVAAIANSAIAVLSDGGVVVAYGVSRDVPQPVGSPPLTKSGVYIQRFDAKGTQVLPETEVASRVQVINSRSPWFDEIKTLALADGGFVVGWADFSFSVLGFKSTVYNQRYDTQGQAVGGNVVVGDPNLLRSSPSYSFAADAQGGYIVSTSQLDAQFNPLVSVTHYDVTQTAKQIVAPRIGSALLLPLEGERYVLFASNSVGSYRQMLDGEGNAVGQQTPISSVPIAARELADGSYVVFWTASSNFTAQRFDSDGAPLGEILPIATSGSAPGIAALADDGFALAWSAASATGDQDVYTQRFTEVLDKEQSARQAKRKACLESAKGMKGHERKTFMDACLN